ncbi:hypothetical protein [Klebsiella pneumoniae]|uniref:hypothetical protein n=1 Tax=Klebsiella pneumoniae TaxID=573 RepID=UPI0031FE84D5
MLVLPRINFHDAGAMRVVKQMGPTISSVCEPDLLNHQPHFCLVSCFGSVSWMYYADSLNGVFRPVCAGRGSSTILLPSLSKKKFLPVAIMMNTTV